MRITDLGAIGAFDVDSDNSFGMNCRGEVCGSRIVNGERHAFLWLPQANYGLAANTLHDLTVLAGLPGYSVANDLNASGIIVGEYVDGNGDKRGIVWNLPAWTGSPNPVPTVAIGTFGGPSSKAISINNDSPPLIVGWADKPNLCGAGGEPLTLPGIRGFVLELGSGLTELWPVLSDIPPDNESTGFALTTKGPGTGAYTMSAAPRTAVSWGAPTPWTG